MSRPLDAGRAVQRIIGLLGGFVGIKLPYIYSAIAHVIDSLIGGIFSKTHAIVALVSKFESMIIINVSLLGILLYFWKQIGPYGLSVIIAE